MGYGPDNNLPLDNGKTITLQIPRYAQVNLTFTSNAAWENAICIYDSNYVKIIEKGNQAGRNLNPEVIARNRSEDRLIYVTGWHKNGAADGGLGWNSSEVRFTTAPGDNAGSGKVAFEDGGGDNDYDDIVADYIFV
jgi:hypothetical protein